MLNFRNVLFAVALTVGFQPAFAQLRIVPAQLPTLAQNELVGRNAAGTGDQSALTAAQVRTLLNVVIGAHTDVVDDLSPQLGADLDTNGKWIDFDDDIGMRTITGDLTMEFDTNSRFRVGDSDAYTRLEVYGTSIGGYVAINGGTKIINGGVLLTERADHTWTPTPTKGEIWVKSGTPNTLIFTDDAGTDTTIGAAVSASALPDLTDVVSATNTNKFALMANGTTGYVGRALVEADISDLTHTTTVAGISDLDNDAATLTIGASATVTGSNTGDQTIPVSGVDFDPVGTDNSTDVTFTGTGTYISIVPATQVVTVDPITESDISDLTHTTSLPVSSITDLDNDAATLTIAASSTISGSNTGDQNLADTVAEITDLDNDAATLTIGASATITGSNTGDSQTLANGVSDVTATASEINGSSDLAGLTAGYVYSADTATTASWKAQSGGGISNVVEDTTPQLGGDLDLNTKAFTGIYTAAVTLADGDLVYMNSSGKMALADADAEATTKGMMGMATEAITVDTTGTFVLMGNYTTTGLTTGGTYYVSFTAGDFTTTVPSGASKQIRVVGFATSTTNLFFNPSSLWAETPP